MGKQGWVGGRNVHLEGNHLCGVATGALGEEKHGGSWGAPHANRTLWGDLFHFRLINTHFHNSEVTIMFSGENWATLVCAILSRFVVFLYRHRLWCFRQACDKIAHIYNNLFNPPTHNLWVKPVAWTAVHATDNAHTKYTKQILKKNIGTNLINYTMKYPSESMHMVK